MKRCCRVETVIGVILCIGLFLGCAGGERKELQKSSKISIKMITSENIHSIMTPDDANVWICGSYGTIYHGVDNGTAWKWEQQNSGVEVLLINGTFVNTQKGWIAGLLGTIVHTTDGGKTWEKQATNTDKHLFNVRFVDEENGWAAGDGNTILHTTDGGKTWERQSEEGDKILNEIYFIDKENGWVVGETGIILNTTDGGKTWNTIMPKSFERKNMEEEYENPRPALFGIAATDKNNVWLCGIDGVIIRTTDAGATWTDCSVGTKLAVYSIFIKDGQGWAIGDKGVYLISSDGGATWKAVEDTIKTKQWLRQIHFTSPEKGWVVGSAGTVVRTLDGGKTWEFLSGLSYAMDFFTMPKALEFKNMVFE